MCVAAGVGQRVAWWVVAGSRLGRGRWGGRRRLERVGSVSRAMQSNRSTSTRTERVSAGTVRQQPQEGTRMLNGRDMSLWNRRIKPARCVMYNEQNNQTNRVVTRVELWRVGAGLVVP